MQGLNTYTPYYARFIKPTYAAYVLLSVAVGMVFTAYGLTFSQRLIAGTPVFVVLTASMLLIREKLYTLDSMAYLEFHLTRPKDSNLDDTTLPKKQKKCRAPRNGKTTPAIAELMYQPGTIEPEPETFHVDRSVEGIALPLTMQGLRFTQPGAAGPPEVADEVHLEYARNNRAILITKDRDFRDMHEAGAEHCGMVLAPHTMDFETIAEFCAKLAREMSK